MRCHPSSARLRPYQTTPSHNPPAIHPLATTPTKTAHINHEEMSFQVSHPASSSHTNQLSLQNFDKSESERTIHWTESPTRSLSLNTRAINHSFQLGAPYSSVLCQFHPLKTKTMSHRLLPPPNSEATSMTLRAQFLFQVGGHIIFLCKNKLLVSLFGSLVGIGAMCPHHEK